MIKLNDLYDMIERDDILLIEKDNGKLSSFSIMDSDKKCAVVIHSDCKYYDTNEKKVQLAHELGHCATGTFYNENSLELRSRCEYRADKWAIKKLLPEEELIEAFEQGYTESWQIADYFDLPEKFIRKACKFYGYYNGPI